MASITQIFFSFPPFKKRYATPVAVRHWAFCLMSSGPNFQMRKLAKPALWRLLVPTAHNGLLSAAEIAEATTVHRFSRCRDNCPDAAFQVPRGRRPAKFRALAGRGRTKFAMMRQKGAGEFLARPLIALRRYPHRAPAPGSSGTEAERDPTDALAFRAALAVQRA